ncbi:MAG: alpha/beta hydrolase, partial [Microcystaceae cyanobacterium]
MLKAHNLRYPIIKLSSFLLGIGAACLTAMPGQAAEKLSFIYSPLNFSVEVSSLELFAKEGKVNKNLEFYLQFVTPEQKAAFR